MHPILDFTRLLPVRRFVCLSVLCFIALGALAAGQTKTKNVVLVTLDGVRIEEMFGGLEPVALGSTLKNGRVEESPLYQQFWAPTPEERREKIMPFFWKTLMKEHGSIGGNPAKGSTVKITNRHRFSYPGYSEILVGRAHDDVIKSNSKIQNSFPSVLEFLKNQLKLETSRVAVFGSWDVFDYIAESKPGSIVINSGFEPYDSRELEIGRLNQLQSETSTPWDSVRHDAYTFRFAMAHLKTFKPRVLYLALGETDDWAHDRRYDRMIKALQLTDSYLQQLWNCLQSDDHYRHQTSILISTDHGRGITASTWPDHGSDVEGAQNIWLAVISPDNSLRGEWTGKPTVYQNQIAATLCRFLGIDFSAHNPEAGKPVEFLFNHHYP